MHTNATVGWGWSCRITFMVSDPINLCEGIQQEAIAKPLGIEVRESPTRTKEETEK